MFKKSFPLLMILACANLSFCKSTDNNNTKAPSALEAALLEHLKNVPADKSAKYLTMQQELDRVNQHEHNARSKPAMGLAATVGGLFLAAIAGIWLDKEAQKNVLLAASAAIGGGVWVMCTYEKDTPYAQARKQLVNNINDLDLNNDKKI